MKKFQVEIAFVSPDHWNGFIKETVQASSEQEALDKVLSDLNVIDIHWYHVSEIET